MTKKPNKTERISIAITKDLKDIVSEAAWQSRKSLNQFIEDAIEEYLKKQVGSK